MLMIKKDFDDPPEILKSKKCIKRADTALYEKNHIELAIIIVIQKSKKPFIKYIRINVLIVKLIYLQVQYYR